MGRPRGSLNRERSFADALRIALCQRPHSLRRIADKLIDRAEEGDLPYVRELIDRLDSRPVQQIDRHDVLIATELSDTELFLTAAGRRSDDELKVISQPKDRA